MVVRVEDLVRWSCAEPTGWSSSPKPPPGGTNGLLKPLQISDGGGGKTSDESGELLKDKTEGKIQVCQRPPLTDEGQKHF